MGVLVYLTNYVFRYIILKVVIIIIYLTYSGECMSILLSVFFALVIGFSVFVGSGSGSLASAAASSVIFLGICVDNIVNAIKKTKE